MKPLRRCRTCGLEAWTQEDLELFKKTKNKPYGRDTWCKKCHVKDQEKYKRNKVEKALIEGFPKPITCSFCKEQITKLTGGSGESLVIHSLDGNHDNWSPINKAPAHRRCHTTFHSPSKNPEVAKKISKALTGITRSPETRAKMSASMTLERRKRLSILMSGSNSPTWKGDKATDKSKYMREWRRRRRDIKWMNMSPR